MTGIFRSSVRLVMFAGCLLVGLQAHSYLDKVELTLLARLFRIGRRHTGQGTT